MKKITRHTRLILFSLISVLSERCLASDVADGRVRYDLGIGELAEMTTEVVATMGYVLGLLYAIASLFTLYNGMVIYIKMQTGEQGITKSILTLFGAIFFLIGASLVLPAFFGYNASAGWSR